MLLSRHALHVAALGIYVVSPAMAEPPAHCFPVQVNGEPDTDSCWRWSCHKAFTRKCGDLTQDVVLMGCRLRNADVEHERKADLMLEKYIADIKLRV